MARIFIVEGEDHGAEPLAISLRAAGHELAGTAISAFEACERVARTSPDLAVVDLRSRSGGDHLELAAELARRFEVPTLFVSGASDLTTLRRLGRVDPAGVLVRPFDDRQLRAAVELALARRARELARRGEADRAGVDADLKLLATLSRRLVTALDASPGPAERRALAAELDDLARARDARRAPLARIGGEAVSRLRERVGHRAMFELTSEGDLWVAGHEGQLVRALELLATVALQSHGAGAGTWLRLALRRDELGLAEVELAVTTESTAPSREVVLAGLPAKAAFAVAEAIVVAHGGAVHTERDGARTLARVTLPCVPAEEGALPLRLVRDPVAAAAG
ncbi:MAG: hypothetical protein QM704_00220 [Anaeromyxobacteraceae bacterium]